MDGVGRETAVYGDGREVVVFSFSMTKFERYVCYKFREEVLNASTSASFQLTWCAGHRIL